MTYDLIIVARSSSPYLIGMTQNCINSAGKVNVILVETSGSLHEYQGVNKYLLYEGEFRYNRALNMALEVAECDFHILANNDIIFYPGWDVIGEQMIYNGFDSASAWFRGSLFPQGDFVYEGYNIAQHLTGWCIFITKEAYKKIGKLNEDMEFWYSDNAYALQLQEHGLRHGIFCNVRVDHIGNQTLNTMPIGIKRKYSHGQLPIFNRVCVKKR
jgi:hypothetical protein